MHGVYNNSITIYGDIKFITHYTIFYHNRAIFSC